MRKRARQWRWPVLLYPKKEKFFFKGRKAEPAAFLLGHESSQIRSRAPGRVSFRFSIKSWFDWGIPCTFAIPLSDLLFPDRNPLARPLLFAIGLRWADAIPPGAEMGIHEGRCWLSRIKGWRCAMGWDCHSTRGRRVGGTRGYGTWRWERSREGWPGQGLSGAFLGL